MPKVRRWIDSICLLSLSLQDEFRSFMLHANPKTRRQNKTAGESVDIEGYVNKMTSNSTDGDHLTLQVSHAARLPTPLPLHPLHPHTTPFHHTSTHTRIHNITVHIL